MVIGIEANAFRLLNDYGVPYLYPSGIFEITDPNGFLKPAKTAKDTPVRLL